MQNRYPVKAAYCYALFRLKILDLCLVEKTVFPVFAKDTGGKDHFSVAEIPTVVNYFRKFHIKDPVCR